MKYILRKKQRIQQKIKVFEALHRNEDNSDIVLRMITSIAEPKEQPVYIYLSRSTRPLCIFEFIEPKI